MSLSGPPPADLLLGRPERIGDLDRAAEMVRDRRVLVTGAAGSIGWPLSHTLLRAEPRRLVLLDHHEHSLFSLERALGPSPHTRYELADVRDAARLARIFDEHAPEVVIHLAAAKHVPYGERFPEGAVAANVLATRSLLELATRADTRAVVYPSSDKSVLPPSVYGATKRLAEVLVQAMCGQRAVGHRALRQHHRHARQRHRDVHPAGPGGATAQHHGHTHDALLDEHGRGDLVRALCESVHESGRDRHARLRRTCTNRRDREATGWLVSSRTRAVSAAVHRHPPRRAPGRGAAVAERVVRGLAAGARACAWCARDARRRRSQASTRRSIA